MQYRRSNTKGGTYFFTVNLAERQRTLLVDEIDVLQNVMRKVKDNHPYHIDAMVVLPDHLHAMWTLPKDNNDYSTRWMLIKSGFSRQVEKSEHISNSRKQKGERGLWQRRFWEHCIKDDKDYEQHVNYIHYNPVKHGYVKNANDWEYSSIHRYLAEGVISKDWGMSSELVEVDSFGERL